jgi:hypothetical protein
VPEGFLDPGRRLIEGFSKIGHGLIAGQRLTGSLGIAVMSLARLIPMSQFTGTCSFLR